MQRNLTQGNVTKSMLLFAYPMILGNLLQQFYNIADTLIVGRFIGSDALAAVGASFTLMTFLTSILLGLCMGSGVIFSMLYGADKQDELKNYIFISFVITGIPAIAIEVLVFLFTNPLLKFLQIPTVLIPMTKNYLQIIFCGILFTFFYNFFAALSRSIGNSTIPLAFLALSTALNIFLDLLFILVFSMGVSGAALATVLSQGISALLMILYCLRHMPFLKLQKKTPIYPPERCFTDFTIFPFNLHPTVDHEFRDPHGTGAGQQLWRHGHGCLCRRRQDRRLCLHAGAGFWQCLFHLYRPKLRCKRKRTHSVRDTLCHHHRIFFQCTDFPDSLCFCKRTDVVICKCVGN